MCSERYAEELAVGVTEVPVAADVVAGLEARVGDPPVAQRLAGQQPAGPGSDHAHRAARSAYVAPLRSFTGAKLSARRRAPDRPRDRMDLTPGAGGGRRRPPACGPARPSLARIRDTWTLAVFSAMNSAAPIWRLVAPSASRASTCRSRGVSPNGSSAAPVAVPGGARRPPCTPSSSRRPRSPRATISSTSHRDPSAWASASAAPATSVAAARSPAATWHSACRQRAIAAQ